MLRLSLAGALAGLVASPASAQAPLAAPPGTPVPRMLPQPQLPTVAPEPAPGLPAEAGAAPQGAVSVATAAVTGATVFPASRLSPFLEGLTGPEVPVAHIVSARDRLLALYREQGYVFSAVRAELAPGPAGATLMLAVTEGHISEVLLDGDIGPAGVQVLRFLRPLTALRPIDIASLERQLLLVQDIPGVAVRAVLRPGTGEPGALQLVAQVSRAAFDGFLNADNRAPIFAGPEQVIGVFGANSFTSLGERVEVLGYTASGASLRFAQGAFETFLGASGLKLRAYVGGGDSKPLLELRRLGYAGTTRVFGASLSYPLIRRRPYSLYALALFDAYDNKIETGPADAQERVSDDQLRMVRLGLDGIARDTFAGSARPATNTASVRVTQGLRGFGAKENSNPIPGRQGSRVDFFKITGEVSRNQTLVAFGEASSISLLGTAGFQWTRDVLPPSEKYFLGGVRFGRGYYNGEITGDSAFGASVELQFTSLAHASLPDATRPIGYQFYGFYDYGQTFERLNDDLNRRISSFGGGVRVTLTDSVQFAFEAARRLQRDPQRTQDEDEELKRWAGYWTLLLRF
ncbi:ShlB/FhaC/HecB family hemolysin secretion/activation protein [Elioraea rosea]|uniref:ShlB/FhaC/HecB family hemolysin secretion/activation protein n=1 Tax=Elioraea rosea TaxID=2492390 RepID=UPI001315A7CE|nr:ShlB/FhaC/HecB family hemolysin secretion/activation protein [Elioraea rosea]